MKDSTFSKSNTNPFLKILNECHRKPNKIWVDRDSELYNRSLKSSYSAYIKGETVAVVVERFIRTLKKIKFTNI